MIVTLTTPDILIVSAALWLLALLIPTLVDARVKLYAKIGGLREVHLLKWWSGASIFGMVVLITVIVATTLGFQFDMKYGVVVFFLVISCIAPATYWANTPRFNDKSE